MGGRKASEVVYPEVLRGRTWSDLSFESGLLVCVGRTDGESAGQGGQKKGHHRKVVESQGGAENGGRHQGKLRFSHELLTLYLLVTRIVTGPQVSWYKFRLGSWYPQKFQVDFWAWLETEGGDS